MSLSAGPKPVAAGGTRRRSESPEDPVPVPNNKEDHPPRHLSVCHSGIFFMDDLNCGDSNYAKLNGDDGDKRESDTGSDHADDAAAADDGGNRREEHRGRVNGGGRGLSGDSGREGRRSPEEEQLDVIFRLIEQKDVEGVKGILKSGKINKNAKNNRGETILMAAVDTRSDELVAAILSAAGRTDGRGEGGATALHVACRNNDAVLVTRLLAASAASGCRSDVNSAAEDGSTPLHDACLHGGDASEVVGLLLDAGASVGATRTRDRTPGYTALHLAAEVGDSASVRVLLSRSPSAAVDARLRDGSTPLHVACRHGYVDVASALLGNGAMVDARADDARGYGATPLHLAVDNSHLFVARAVIEAGADVNATRVCGARTGVTALHLAAVRRSADAVRLLLDAGARPDAQDGDGCTALHIAARGGQGAVVEMLVKHGAPLDHGMASKQSVNQTPLHLAVRFRHYEVARQLIAAGCSVNVSEKMAVSKGNGSGTDDPAAGTAVVDAYTPLHWAVENGDLEMVCLLLDSDALPNATASFEDNTGLTPLHLACQDGYSRIAEELLRCPGCDRNPLKRTLNRENITPLHQATYNGHADAVRVLLDGRCDVNVQADNGYCALHYAAQQGNVDMTRMILRHGGDVNLLASAKDQLNITALHLAVQSGNAGVVRALVDAGSTIDAEKTMGEIQGVTPLHQAAYQEKAEIVAMLLELGAAVNKSMNGWYTALHVAAEKGNAAIVAVLLQGSADPNAKAALKDHSATTPLHVAAQHGHTAVVRQLVAAGADPQATRSFADRAGITALHLAVESGFEDTARALVELGCDRNAADSLRFTPLHVAVQYDFPSVVRFLLDAECDTRRRTIAGLTAGRMADQLGNTAIRQMFKEERRKSSAPSFSFRQKNIANQTQTPTKIVVDSANNKSDTRTSKFMRLLCGLNSN